MKKITALLFICIAAAFMSVCSCAEEPAYRDDLKAMLDETEALEGPLKTASLTQAAYAKWYEDFKDRGSSFAMAYGNTHKMRSSFLTARDALNGFSLAVSLLSRAKEAERMYAESIGSSDISYAHKWKADATSSKKEALAKVSDSIALLKEAVSAAGSEN